MTAHHSHSTGPGVGFCDHCSGSGAHAPFDVKVDSKGSEGAVCGLDHAIYSRPDKPVTVVQGIYKPVPVVPVLAATTSQRWGGDWGALHHLAALLL